jgi:hypothetical protein
MLFSGGRYNILLAASAEAWRNQIVNRVDKKSQNFHYLA